MVLIKRENKICSFDLKKLSIFKSLDAHFDQMLKHKNYEELKKYKRN